jgi:hypothetical protein
MLKQEVLDLIAANLATGSNITAAEHRAVEEAIVNYVGFQTVAYGKVGPIDIDDGTLSWDVVGTISTAVRVATAADYVVIRLTFPSGLLTSTNFKVRTEVESNSSNVDFDNNLDPVIFKKVGSSTTQVDIVLEDTGATTASIYLHVEIVQL